MTTIPRTTRLAPSPTGALHLGNARTFLVNWAIARQRGWRIVLRIEDLDGPRVKAGAAEGAMEDLRWLGLDWDTGPSYQRSDLAPYHAALRTLLRRGFLYPCGCSRKEIAAAQSAPHGDEHELRYPGTCRDKPFDINAAMRDPAGAFPDSAWRVRVPKGCVTLNDMIAGPRSVDVQAEVGDFIVATKAGLPGYQLAVVVDDARQDVTDVIRGDDLITSAARQLLIYRLLGPDSPPADAVMEDLPHSADEPTYWHLPLVLGEDGRRLAKRHGDSRIFAYREAGVAPERVIGLLAYWSGLASEPAPMSTREFLVNFDVSRLPRRPVLFNPSHHAWLLAP